MNDGPDINTQSKQHLEMQNHSHRMLLSAVRGEKNGRFFRNDKPQRPSVCVCVIMFMTTEPFAIIRQ